MTKTEKIDFAFSEHISLLHNNQDYLKNKIDEVSLILIDALFLKCHKVRFCHAMVPQHKNLKNRS